MRVDLRLLLLLAIVSFTTSARAEENVQRVGVMLCQTGNCADWGIAALRGAELAVERINASGGVLSKRIELIVEDTNEAVSGAQAVTAFQNLLARGVKHFVGPSWSPGALAVLPIAKKRSDIVIITPSASAKEFSSGAPFVFNIRPLEDLSTIALAKYCFDHGKRRAAIFSSEQPATLAQGRLFEEEFRKLGGTVTIRIEPPASQSDLRTEALKIVRSNPDAIFLMNYLQIEAGAQALDTLKSKALRVAISIDDARAAQAGGALEGVVVAKASQPSAAFREDFLSRFQMPAGLSAEGGFDAIMALTEAARRSGSFDAKLIASELSAGKFSGAIGDFEFDGERHVLQAPEISVVRGGRLVPIAATRE